MGALHTLHRWFADRPRLADGLLVVLLWGINAALALSIEDGFTGGRVVDRWWMWVLIALPPVAVAFRRTDPVLALVGGTAATFTVWSLGLPEYGMALCFVVYSVVVYGPPRRGLRLAVTSAVGLTAWTGVGVLLADVPYATLPIMGLLLATAVAFGSATAARHAHIAEVEERAAEAEQRRAADERHVIAQERARIARELHDVVAHGLSVIVVQAGAGRRIIDADPDGARTTLQQIETTARSGLTEMRQVLGVLRTEEAEQRRPAPGLAALDDLFAQYRSSGLELTSAIDSIDGTVPSTVDSTVYRIIEESLTNALRHGGPNVSAHVRLGHDDGGLRLVVLDDGRGAAAPTSAEGHGLRGMSERVEVHGGSLRTGPRPGGGFEVRVWLPLDSRHAPPTSTAEATSSSTSSTGPLR